MDLDDDEMNEMDGMSEWIMERVYCLERGVQIGGSQKRKIDKNLQTVNLDRIHMMIGRRLSNFKMTHPEGWQKLDNLDEIRTGGIVILRNVYDSFAQLQNLFQPKAYQTPFANLNQAVCKITGVGKETVGKWCVRKDEPIYKGILDQKAQE
ncbi:hypothetical protein WR25_20934 [Diploscapter pachys]|uniref:Uncharacterized protein n=1 Tax=Diploscapter pachys TaxID=2018661 RepID=A0A2A2KAY2_9BILA|nr:hypothetical protein WR25_20934 [Diploscapter pachys]